MEKKIPANNSPTENTKSVKISQELYNKLYALSKKESRFINYYFNKSIQQYLKRRGL